MWKGTVQRDQGNTDGRGSLPKLGFPYAKKIDNNQRGWNRLPILLKKKKKKKKRKWKTFSMLDSMAIFGDSNDRFLFRAVLKQRDISLLQAFCFQARIIGFYTSIYSLACISITLWPSSKFNKNRPITLDHRYLGGLLYNLS